MLPADQKACNFTLFEINGYFINLNGIICVRKLDDSIFIKYITGIELTVRRAYAGPNPNSPLIFMTWPDFQKRYEELLEVWKNVAKEEKIAILQNSPAV